MDTIQLIAEISVLKKKMDKAEAFLEELVEYLLVTCKDDDYITPEVICRKLAKYGYIELENGYWVNPLADRKTEPQYSEDDIYWLSLVEDVANGKMSDAGANQAWLEYINHKTEPSGYNLKPVEDEPQTNKGVSYTDHTDYKAPKTYVTWTEPTDCPWK